MSRPIKVGVLGCGAAAMALHLPALAALEEFEVAAVTDRDCGRAHAAATRFGARTAPGVEALAAQVDVVAVLTLAHEHLVAGVLDTGTHVVSEKPLSLDPALGNQLRARAHREHLMLRVGAMRAHDPVAVALLEATGPGPRTGVLTKIDGADAAARAPFQTPATHLPAGPPLYPLPLSRPGQRRAVEILAWEGYHLLTLAVMATTAPRTARAFVLGAGWRTVHATFTDAADQPMTITVGPGPEGTYLDHARLMADRTAAADFALPYPHGPGQAPHPAFAALWRDIAHQLTRGEHPVDTLGADVETLASALAALTTT